ncbi:N-acyl-D-amino-acid deacylase family protein [Emcibacter sp.]|uniref:N-acyl-D-amino-acid deacylase family protein n=1 Tax=Emcibacter sp. TaxID=1979954 RepID=UPI002AA95736|nr:amidohydrolase family protein [Emcibacter sp.]
MSIKGFFGLILIMLFTAIGVTGAYADDNQSYDIVIRNGFVLDGAGNPWVKADVAIKDGRFVKVGRVTGRGEQEIDASGLYVSPGWIDMMDQSGRVLLENGLAENKLLMGVTTVISGEGGTPVPAEQIGKYFDQLEEQGISLNFGTYYQAAQARMAVMGDAEGKPTDEQVEQMKAHVGTAMEQGVFGITTALVYPPSSFHTTEELIEMSKVVAQYGGIYASHIRGEGRDLLKSVDEAITIGRDGGVSVEIFHLKAAYQPGWGKYMRQVGNMINAARAEGIDVAADLYPYPAGGTGLDISVPAWVFKDGTEKGMERLRDSALRPRLKEEFRSKDPGDWSNMVQEAGGWGNVVLANSYNHKYEKYHFMTIKDIARDLGKDPEDVAWDIMLEALPNRALALYFMMNEEDIQYALSNFPWLSIGSDAAATAEAGGVDDLGLPHPRSYGTFPRIISEYVKKKNVISLPDAIRKMTSWPASRMGIHDRGVIREGLWADVVIFDLKTIEDTANWKNPTLYPEGIEYVFVNGVTVVDKGEHTGTRPGKALKGKGYNPAGAE